MPTTQPTTPPRELGDFQTPPELAREITEWLAARLGVRPAFVLEPTCGVGAFLVAAAATFPGAELTGLELQPEHVAAARAALAPERARARVEQTDFLDGRWAAVLDERATAHPSTELLVLGNPPWVTTAAIGAIGGGNRPARTVPAGFSGWRARTGDSNFDVAEWMIGALLDHVTPVPGRHTVAMVCKRSVARKLVERIERDALPVREVHLVGIDARRAFGAAVEACVAVFRTGDVGTPTIHEYASLAAEPGPPMGRRHGITVRDLPAFDAHAAAHLGPSPTRWRSGVKHDAAAILELHRAAGGERWRNGLGEEVDVEPEVLFPFLKGGDVDAGRAAGERALLVPNRAVGADTDALRTSAPRAWAYLDRHRARLDARRSRIYHGQPPFTVYGVGPYAFLPHRVVVSGLHARPNFRLLGPVGGQPVLLDDTVYAAAFETAAEARAFHVSTQDPGRIALLMSMVFPDDKRPIKARLLNAVRW